MNFKKILIANRSEIASRIIKACKALDIETVAIYTPEDQLSKYVYEASEAFPLSLSGIAGYMNQDEILKIAHTCQSDAIHPGYGFLAEMSEFSQKVIAANLVWIGPSPKSIKLMGNKIEARTLMQNTNVPIIPGYHCNSNYKSRAKKEACKIGYPVLLKAALGGGGKAIRKINNESEFEQTWDIVNLETKKFFDSSEIFLEKYIENARHIEVQIAADGKNFIHLFERECSIQRRHQKIIEECPCNFVKKETLSAMYEIAIKAAKSINYKNIGTVEFILDSNDNFYFLEMNTRLQVEHPISELTTGIDLVKLQIEIAQTNHLALCQEDITRNGHAIECRILAEDPANNFIPCCGKIQNLNLPTNPFIRHDHILEEDLQIQPFFDPMISKLISFGKNRETAQLNMISALGEFNISNIKTNISFLKYLLESPQFQNGQFHTASLNNSNDPLRKNFLEEKNNNESSEENVMAAIAATLIFEKLNENNKTNNKQQQNNSWKETTWR
jgi:acetyl-CoA carboxylase, biotin carboxylase subunit